MSPKSKVKIPPIQGCDWSTAQLPGLNDEEKAQLLTAGMTTTKILLAQTRTPVARYALANKMHLNINDLNKWVALADLARLPSVGVQYCGLLLHAGVVCVAQLAQIPVHRLHQQLMRLVVTTMQRRDLCPPIEQVSQWSQQAKRVLSAESTVNSQ